MKKLKGKILYWIFQRYFKKHIVVLTDQKVISEIDLIHTPIDRREDMMQYYYKEIVHDIVKKAIEDGLVIMERERNIELGGEIITARMRFWK